jgi:electron transport complex protein RnfD
VFGQFAGAGWEWISLAWLLGGLWLLVTRTIRWHIPVSFLIGVTAMATLFYLVDPQNHGSPLFHLLSGAVIIGAFFIATDPVTAATTDRGRLLYGLLIGLLVYVIRAWGGYPDGVAFAVLLANMCVPLIDYYTQPRVYGDE